MFNLSVNAFFFLYLGGVASERFFCVICLGRCGSSESIPHTTAASSLGDSGATKGLP